MATSSTENQENKNLKIQSATLVGGNTDGEKLYLEIELFDGEHTNRFEPEFPADTSADKIIEYMRGIVEKNTRLPDDITGIMQQTVYWSADDQAWFKRQGNNKPVRLSDEHQKHSGSHATHHTAHHTTHKK